MIGLGNLVMFLPIIMLFCFCWYCPVLQSKLRIGFLLLRFFKLFTVAFMSGNDPFWCFSILRRE